MAKIKKMSDGEKKKLTKRLLMDQCCNNCEFKDDMRFHHLKASKHCYCIRKGKLPDLMICSHWKKDKRYKPSWKIS